MDDGTASGYIEWPCFDCGWLVSWFGHDQGCTLASPFPGDRFADPR